MYCEVLRNGRRRRGDADAGEAVLQPQVKRKPESEGQHREQQQQPRCPIRQRPAQLSRRQPLTGDNADRAKANVRGEVPRIGDCHGACGECKQSERERESPWGDAVSRKQHGVQAQADGQQGKRHRHEVGVQVGEEEGEEGELRDLETGRVRRHHARGRPEVEVGDSAAHKLPTAVQVAQDDGHRNGSAARGNGGPSWGANRAEQPSPSAFRDGVPDGEGSAGGQGKEEGHGKVVGRRRRNARYANDRRHHELTVGVVVQGATGKPRVKRRHGGGTENGVQVREVHGLFAAQVRVPQVRVCGAHEHEGQERCEEEGLLRKQDSPAPSHKAQQALAEAVGQPA